MPGRRGGRRSRAACRRRRLRARARGPAARSATRIGSPRPARRRRPAPGRSGSRSPSAGSGTAPAAARAARRAPRCRAPRRVERERLVADHREAELQRLLAERVCVSAGVEIATASAPAAFSSASEANVRLRVLLRDQCPPLGGGGHHPEEVALRCRAEQRERGTTARRSRSPRARSGRAHRRARRGHPTIMVGPPAARPRERRRPCTLADAPAVRAEIGRALFISPITVRNHVSSILATLQVSNRREAMLRVRPAGETGTGP